MLKIFEAFSGVGAQKMAVSNITNEYEIVATSEIDKTAIIAYNAIHYNKNMDFQLASNNIKNLGDISKIKNEKIPEHDIFTYSFPCQDISSIGTRKGLDKDSGTRSSLLWDCAKIIELKKPKYLILENVKNLVTGINKNNFYKWLNFLEKLGYENYWDILDSSDFGIPQRRKRVFVVSKYGKSNINLVKKNKFYEKNIYDIIDKKQDDWIEFIPKSKVKGNIEEGEIKFLDDRDWKMNGVMISDICSTQRAGRSGLKYIKKVNNKIYERKLNALECCRLMGYKDEAYKNMKNANISDNSIMRLCGNSIVVNVIENIMMNILEEEKYD